ncbi:MAG: OmpA family protein [Kiritimatiellae bacterium]|nr:OmpA family protein [Kiritimatiellia bacterium]MDD5521020.1 OmpA family protein [Kiritimatiellia bacterium]
MKLNGYLRGIVVAGFVCGLLMSSGCRHRKPTASSVSPTDIGTGGAVLSERPDSEGMRITGAEVEFVKNVLFAYDSFQITDSEVAKIKAVAEFMKANSGVRLVSEGHCDERGTAEYNMSLGENRALAVRAYLIGLGIDGARIQTKSFGEEKPLETGHNEASWSMNRRVEFGLYRK